MSLFSWCRFGGMGVDWRGGEGKARQAVMGADGADPVLGHLGLGVN